MICGVDEAGKGPVLGPLVVAGVCFSDEEFINNLGVKDSKKHTPRRRQLFEKIIKQHAVSYELLIIPASDIDDMRKVMTMNEIEVFAFTKVIKKLKKVEVKQDEIVKHIDDVEKDIKKNIEFRKIVPAAQAKKGIRKTADLFGQGFHYFIDLEEKFTHDFIFGYLPEKIKKYIKLK